MQTFVDITHKWQQFGQGSLTLDSYPIAIRPSDQLRLERLCQHYPRLSRAEIVRDLLKAALHDIEQGLLYQPGKKIIAVDEMGDNIYEDDGLTPRFLALTKQHHQALLALTPQ